MTQKSKTTPSQNQADESPIGDPAVRAAVKAVQTPKPKKPANDGLIDRLRRRDDEMPALGGGKK